jgi:hypothetical protein
MMHEQDNGIDTNRLPNTSILELQNKYGIARTSLYRRMRYLQIKTTRIAGKAYLSAQQVVYMDKLHEYLKTNKKMDGYIKSESIRPDGEEKQTATLQAQTISDEAEIAVISTPLSHRDGYIPKFLAQLVMQTL